METSTVIRRKDGDHAGKLIGPFDLPAEAVAHAMAVLGLDSTQFVVEVVHAPRTRPPLHLVGRPTSRRALMSVPVPNDAA